MATINHTLEYWAAATGIKIANALSPQWADRFGGWLGAASGVVLRSRRRIAMQNLRRALPNELTEVKRREIVDGVFRNTGRTLIEFARFETIGIDGVRTIVAGPAFPELDTAMQRGKGAIIVTAHFGCWELLGAWVATHGYPMDFLIGTQHNAKVDDLLVGFRRAMGVGVIRLSTSARSVFKALKQNRVTGLVADQHAASGGVVTPFFGRPAATPRGPAIFAIRANCPLLPILIRRERYDRHIVIKGEPIYPPHSGDEELDIRTMTAGYTGFFEKHIREHPDQWLWTHRRWKLD